MSRWLLVSLVIACGGSREVSKIKYTHTSCDDCGIAPSGNEGFVLPDSERDIVPPGHGEQPPAAANARPPEPTCTLVGETLASFELGNYADPEERAPKVAAETQRCTAMRLTRDDRQCIVDSYDRTSVAYCVPALFPNEPVARALEPAECNAIAKQMTQNLDAQLRSRQVPDQRVWERQLLAAIDACRGDRWNEAMGQCAISYVPLNTQVCAYIQPHAMYKRLEARLAKARGE